MKQILHSLLLLALLALGFLPSQVRAQESLLESLVDDLKIEGLETTYDPETNIASSSGNVRIEYDGVIITAGRAQYNMNTGEVVAFDQVTAYKDGQIYQSDTLIYDSKSGKISSGLLSSSLSPIYYETKNFKTNSASNSEIFAQESLFTTHDSERPNWKVRARALDIRPGSHIIFRRATVFLGETPIFWLPYFYQPLNDELGYFLTPGYRSEWGAYLLNEYGQLWGDHTLAKYHVDLRSNRGLALGLDLRSLQHNDNQKNLKGLSFYYTRDTDPGTDLNDFRKKDLKMHRYRVKFQHRIYIPAGEDDDSLYVDFDLHKLSDEYFNRDFFIRDHQLYPNPDNIISITKTHDRGTATLFGRWQVNDFFRTDTRQPEFALDITRQRIGKTGLFYQSETSFGNYGDDLSEYELYRLGLQRDNLDLSIEARKERLKTIRNIANPITRERLLSEYYATYDPDAASYQLALLESQIEETSFWRAHTYHELLYPLSLQDGINFVPRVGLGGTAYWDVHGLPGAESDYRGMFHAGFDFSARFSKVYENVESQMLGINQIRHVIEPFANYSYLAASDLDNRIVPIDGLAPSVRPRPLDPALFTATDAFRDWNILRLGVRNLLQTNRDGRAYQWFTLRTYMDIFFEDPEFDRSISNLYNELRFSPVPWFYLDVLSQLPISNDEYAFSEVTTSATWLPTPWLQLNISHRYIDDHPFFGDSNVIRGRAYTRLGDNWGASLGYTYELNEGQLDRQEYMLHRDLTTWTASLGAVINELGGGQGTDLGLVLTFTLKDFPNVRIPIDFDMIDQFSGGNN